MVVVMECGTHCRTILSLCKQTSLEHPRSAYLERFRFFVAMCRTERFCEAIGAVWTLCHRERSGRVCVFFGLVGILCLHYQQTAPKRNSQWCGMGALGHKIWQLISPMANGAYTATIVPKGDSSTGSPTTIGWHIGPDGRFLDSSKQNAKQSQQCTCVMQLALLASMTSLLRTPWVKKAHTC